MRSSLVTTIVVLALSTRAAVAAHLPSPPATPHEPDAVVVVLAPGASLAPSADGTNAKGVLGSTLARFGLARTTLLAPASGASGDIVRLVSDAPGFDPEAAAAALREQPGVIAASPDVHLTLDLAPNDPYFDTQWHLSTSAAGLHAQPGWSLATGSPSQLIAILDTGVDLEHADLVANIWTNPDEIADNGIDDDLDGYVDDVHGWDFGDHDADPNPTPIFDSYYGIDEGWHGTFVAGVAAASGNNGIGISGVAWNCRILPVKITDVDGNVLLSAVVNGIAYATARHAAVLNMSFGTTSVSAGAVFQAAITAAVDGNVVCVASAGNAGTDTPQYPAACDSVLAVAATTPSNVRADWSNWGAYVDLAAPGESIWSTICRNYAYDDYSSLAFEQWFGFDGMHAYMYNDGTSFAAPVVSGAVGVVRSAWPGLNAREIMLQMVLDGEPHVFDNPIGPKLDLERALTYALAVDPAPAAGPARLALAAPSPNPASGATRFTLALPRAGRARLDVFDAAGRLVRTLADGVFDAGTRSLAWDLRDADGRAVGAGVYFARLASGAEHAVRRVAVIR